MKEGKLSSALMERYGIDEENAVGTVLWHSLNESGEIEVWRYCYSQLNRN